VRERAGGQAEQLHDWAGEFAAAQPRTQQSATGTPPHAHVDTPRYIAHHPDGARCRVLSPMACSVSAEVMGGDNTMAICGWVALYKV
jgi:hypothetical protein